MSLKWENEDQREIISTLENELKLSQEREMDLQSEQQDIRLQLMKLESTQDELDELKFKKQNLEQENLQLKMKITDLASQRSAEKSKANEINEALKSKLEALTHQVEQMGNRPRVELKNTLNTKGTFSPTFFTPTVSEKKLSCLQMKRIFMYVFCRTLEPYYWLV